MARATEQQVIMGLVALVLERKVPNKMFNLELSYIAFGFSDFYIIFLIGDWCFWSTKFMLVSTVLQTVYT